ncbi:MAG: hypothetical protein AAF488_19150 [Planctomycetota bacterium]
MSSYEEWDREGFREDHLGQTLRHAIERVPFYRELAAEGKLDPDDLESFPVVDASLLSERLQDFLVLDRFPDQVLVTGGTTGRPSLVFRSVDEYERMWERQFGIQPGEMLPIERIQNFKIFACDMTHGAYFDAPHGQPLLRLPFKQTLHAGIVKRFIEEGLRVDDRVLPAVSLEMEFLDLKLFTAYLLAEGVDPASSGIRKITSYGYHTPRGWRERLAKTWGAEVSTFYGLSEFNLANMREIDRETGFQIPMQVVPEIFAPDRSGPIPDGEEGDGVLVLTSLHPYIEIQPRIRYWTNDVVSRTGFNEDVGDVCYRYRGRKNLCVIVEDDGRYETILTATDVVDVVDEIDGVHRDDGYVADFCGGFYGGGWTRERLGYASGIPQFGFVVEEENGEPVRVTVTVELAEAPDGGRAESIEAEVREQLFEERPPLCDALHDHDVELVIRAVGPGGIAEAGEEVVVV